MSVESRHRGDGVASAQARGVEGAGGSSQCSGGVDWAEDPGRRMGTAVTSGV